MHFLSIRHGLTAFLAVSAFALGTHQAKAENPLTTDQFNQIKIERRKLIVAREKAISQIVANERKIEIYLAWADGKDPNVITDKAIPAASAAMTGAGASVAMYKKYFPAFLSKLPANVQKWIKRSPALTGLLAAIYLAYDSMEYNTLVNEMKMRIDERPDGGKPITDALYQQLISERTKLADEIELLSLQINELNALLNIYE